MKRRAVAAVVALVVLAVAFVLVQCKSRIEAIVVRMLKHHQQKVNADLYLVLDGMHTNYITRTSVPESLRRRIHIVNVRGLAELSARQKCGAVLKKLCDAGALAACRKDLVVFDVLHHIGAYFPSMHTDTEWNKVENSGFQIWCLEHNKNREKVGNMFIFENAYLEQKYKGTMIFVRPRGGKILVVNNCLWSEGLLGGVRDAYILEEMTVEQFVNTTTKHYLDFEDGDCMMFAPDLLHMSDYRDTTDLRRSFNFRVVIKDANGNLRLDRTGCGYVNSISASLQNPSMYDLVPEPSESSRSSKSSKSSKLSKL